MQVVENDTTDYPKCEELLKRSQIRAMKAKQSNWNKLVDEQGKQTIVSTPKGLITALDRQHKQWMQGTHVNGISNVKHDGDLIIVHTEKGKNPAGGNFYINKNNMKQAIWD